MTQPTIKDDEQARRSRESAARQRFFAIGLFRFSGALLVMFGFAIMMQRFSWVQGTNAKIMGAIFACVGMFQFMIIPRLMIQAFRRVAAEPPEGADQKDGQGGQ